jgi:hypothetical protein
LGGQFTGHHRGKLLRSAAFILGGLRFPPTLLSAGRIARDRYRGGGRPGRPAASRKRQRRKDQQAHKYTAFFHQSAPLLSGLVMNRLTGIILAYANRGVKRRSALIFPQDRRRTSQKGGAAHPPRPRPEG